MAPSILATICLVLALFITFGLAMATSFFTAAPLKGPDAMGYSMVFLGLGFRWTFTLVALVCCITQDKFAWLTPRPGIAALITIAAHAGLGVIASLAWLAWSGGAKWFTVPAANLGAIAMPVLVQLYLVCTLWAKPEHLATSSWPRLIAWPFAGLGAIGLVIGAGMLVMWQVNSIKADAARVTERQAAIEQNRLDDIAREKQQADDLAALSDDAPLDQFLSHLFIDKTEAHHQAALARITALPNLTQRLADRLADPDPRQREYAANFIRMSPTPDPAWLPAVRNYLALLARDAKAAPALYDQQTMLSYRGLTQGAMMTARKYPDADFTPEVAALREAFSAHEAGQVRDDAVALLDRFTAGLPLTDK